MQGPVHVWGEHPIKGVFVRPVKGAHSAPSIRSIAFLREQIKDDKRVHMCHICTHGQLADIMTKPLVASVFHPLVAFALG